MDFNSYLSNAVANNPYLANAYQQLGLDVNGNRAQPVNNFNFGQTPTSQSVAPAVQQNNNVIDPKEATIMKQYFVTLEKFFQTDKGKIAKERYYDPLDKELNDYVIGISNPQQAEVKNEIADLKKMVGELANVIVSMQNNSKGGIVNEPVHGITTPTDGTPNA